MNKLTGFFSSPKKVIALAAVILLIIGALYFATSSSDAAKSNRGIGLEKSLAVALADAGYSQSEVQNLKGSFDKDDGVEVYDIYFTAGTNEFEYTIKASDGTILEASIETTDGVTGQLSGSEDIGLEAAKTKALNHAGLKASQVDFTKAKKSVDDGRVVYEIEFYNDKVEYDYEIDAAKGTVLEYDKDNHQTASDSSSNSTGGNGSSSAPSSKYIGVDKAKSIALKDAGISASQATFTKAKLDKDDGIYTYEIDFHAGNTEYDYEIDATSGKILERESEGFDHDDDDDDDDDHDDDWDDDHDDDHDEEWDD